MKVIPEMCRAHFDFKGTDEGDPRNVSCALRF
jgi:hypothetical protein